jgi:putative ABC transport system substrate-binding protein
MNFGGTGMVHNRVVKTKLLPILFLFLLVPGISEAEPEIVAVQSIRVRPYEEAIEGFRSICDVGMRRVVLSEVGRAGAMRSIRDGGSEMILAIGGDALSMAKEVKHIPIVYTMVLNPLSRLSGEDNIRGVSMNIPPKQQLRALLRALPHVETLGLLYDPDRTGLFVREAHVAALGMGITLKAREIHSPKHAPSLIMDMRGKIDAFWMLPDITVITPQTVEFLVLFSLENTIPLLAFSEKYVELGAFMSTGIDAFDMGRQAGEIANRIVAGVDVSNVHHAGARRLVVSTNLMVARKLGITVDMAMHSGTGTSQKIIREARMLN